MQLHGQLSLWVRWIWADWNHSIPYVREQNPPAVSEEASHSVNIKFPVKLPWQETWTYRNFYILKTTDDDNKTLREAPVAKKNVINIEQ